MSKHNFNYTEQNLSMILFVWVVFNSCVVFIGTSELDDPRRQCKNSMLSIFNHTVRRECYLRFPVIYPALPPVPALAP